MKKLFLLISCAAVLFTGCIGINYGFKTVRCNGPVEEVYFEDLKDFSKIEAFASVDLNIVQADTFSVKVTANKEVFDYLEYQIKDETLHLVTKDSVALRAEKYVVDITLPYIEKIEVFGAGDVDFKGNYASDKSLAIDVNGAADINIGKMQVPSVSIDVNGAGDIAINDLDAEMLSIEVNGAGDVVVAGKCEKCSFSVNGAGDIDAKNLECNDVKTHKSGLASIALKK